MSDASASGLPVTCSQCGAENDPAALECVRCQAPMSLIATGSLVAERYEILEPIGTGGMGHVYKAHDRTLDETVALKFLRTLGVPSPEMAARFRYEIKLARRVRHRNVCGIHDIGQDGTLQFISMEYVDGVDLKQRLEDRGVLPPGEAIEIAIQAGRGLQAIHEAGIIHRDLKPANIIIDTKGTVRLGDFGVAKLLESDSMWKTAGGVIVGTPEYMSPEQARGEELDARSDLYALGILIYELFVGTTPFQADTPLAAIFKQMHQEPRIDARIPAQLQPLVRRALAKDREARPGSVREFLHALRPITPIETTPLVLGTPPPAPPAPSFGDTLPPIPLPEVEHDAPTVTGRADPTPLAEAELESLPDPAEPPATPAVPAPRLRWRLLAAGLAAGALLGAAGVAVYLMRTPARQVATQPAPATTLAPAAPATPATAVASPEPSEAPQAVVATTPSPPPATSQAPAPPLTTLAVRVAQATPAPAPATTTLAPATPRPAPAATPVPTRVAQAAAPAPVPEAAPRATPAPLARAATAKLTPTPPITATPIAPAPTPDPGAELAELLRQADAALEERHWDAAVSLFDSALVLAPQDQRASAGRVQAALAAQALRRRFEPGGTSVSGPGAKDDLEGFSSEDVALQKAPQLTGRIEFEVSPPAVTPGTPYTLKVFLVCDGKKPASLRTLTLTQTVNGQATEASPQPRIARVEPKQRALLHELSGVWPADVRTWEMQVALTSTRDETLSSRLRWR